MGRASRDKGARGERELATLLSYAVKEDVKRRLGQAREGGADILSLPGFVIEVKRQEVLHLNSWWQQVLKASAGTNKIPLLAYRQNRKPWTFCLPMDLLTPNCQGFFSMAQTEFIAYINGPKNPVFCGGYAPGNGAGGI